MYMYKYSLIVNNKCLLLNHIGWVSRSPAAQAPELCPACGSGSQRPEAEGGSKPCSQLRGLCMG